MTKNYHIRSKKTDSQRDAERWTRRKAVLEKYAAARRGK